MPDHSGLLPETRRIWCSTLVLFLDSTIMLFSSVILYSMIVHFVNGVSHERHIIMNPRYALSLGTLGFLWLAFEPESLKWDRRLN